MHTRSGGSTHITMPNFLETGPSKADILRFFEFSKWLSPPSWIVRFAKFYWLVVSSGGPRRITVPNFVIIGHSVAEILRFFQILKMVDTAIWIFEISSSCYSMNISIFDAFGWKMLIHAP